MTVIGRTKSTQWDCKEQISASMTSIRVRSSNFDELFFYSTSKVTYFGIFAIPILEYRAGLRDLFVVLMNI